MRHLLRTALLVAALGSVLPARAQAGTKAEEDQAFTLYQEARTFFERGDFQGALVRLKEAWVLFKHPAIALKLAEVYEKLGQPERALQTLRGVTHEDPDFAGRLKARIGALEAQLKKPLKVSVVSNAEQTTVTIDNRDKRIPPFDIFLARGIHVLEAQAPGYRRSRVVLNVRGVAPLVQRFDLQALTGTVSIESPDESLQGIRILVDGVEWVLGAEERSQKTTRPRTVRVGQHQLVCWRDGFTKDLRTFSLEEGADLKLLCDTRPPNQGTTTRVWAYTTGSAGLLSIGAGVVLLVSYKHDIDKGHREDLNVQSTKQIFGPIFLGAGVGLGILSAILFRKAARQDARSGVETLAHPDRPRWMVGPGPGLGVGVGARY